MISYLWQDTLLFATFKIQAIGAEEKDIEIRILVSHNLLERFCDTQNAMLEMCA